MTFIKRSGIAGIKIILIHRGIIICYQKSCIYNQDLVCAIRVNFIVSEQIK